MTYLKKNLIFSAIWYIMQFMIYVTKALPEYERKLAYKCK